MSYFQWNRWALQDVERAECPLTEANEESYPVGCQISLNSKLVIKKGVLIFFLLS